MSVPIRVILRPLAGLDCLLAAHRVVNLDHLVPPEAYRVFPSMLLYLCDHLVDHAGTPALHDFLAPPLDGLEHLVGRALPTACQGGSWALYASFGL